MCRLSDELSAPVPHDATPHDGGSGGCYDRAVAAIDEANRADPTTVLIDGIDVPLALAHGQRGVHWVLHLAPSADDPVLLAARAHHLRRWEVPRRTYPEGKPGYLRWRRDQKARHANDVASLLAAAGYTGDTITRVQSLIKREHLGTDAPTQLVEDAACLVFLETQFAEFAAANEHDKVLDIVRKTARKMSPAGLAAVGDIGLGDHELAIIGEALSA